MKSPLNKIKKYDRGALSHYDDERNKNHFCVPFMKYGLNYRQYLDHGSRNLLSNSRNHFAFGGITGFSTVVSWLTHWSASDFTSVTNTALLLFGFLFLGKALD